MEFQSPSINKRQKSIKQFYVKYQEVILFNRNIIIAAVASIIADAVVVHYSAEAISNDILVSLISIITDTGIYLAAFACMFYIDNRRKKYIDVVTGKRDSSRLKHDARKIVTALGVSELVYIITKFISIYLLLQTMAASPYQVALQCLQPWWHGYFI